MKKKNPPKKPASKSASGIAEVRKRDGRLVPFDISRVSKAIGKAMKVVGESNMTPDHVAERAYEDLLDIKKNIQDDSFIPTVEIIQDLVEKALIKEGLPETAKHYILYREARSKVREEVGEVPANVKKLVADSKKYFKNPLAELVYYRTYSKWIDAEGRRETWIETVDRYMDFMKKNLGKKLTPAEYKEVRDTVLRQEAMPSMRLVQFAGPAAERTNVCAYNCSYTAPASLRDIAEIMYVSMCGTGVGFSVESQNVQALPQIAKQTGKKEKTYVVADSKEGWTDALIFGLETWFAGKDVEFDLSQLRPAGARLKTMGGKSSGPEPLRQVLGFARERILRKQGKRLSNLDVHDIICKIGECVVAGGVRRSALISLSDLDDEAMRDAKKGQFWNSEAQRMLANNSAVYNHKPETVEFMDEWIALMKSGSGERGIFNRGNLSTTLPERRVKLLGDRIGWIGTNPCGEILLQPKQFCNLSEVVARSEDTEKSLMRKIRIATILGTYQSTLTYFPYLSKAWTKNCEEERLLGVSITGQWDSKAAREPKILAKLRDEAVRINKLYAKRFGVNQSSCITCVKPSGTVSQTVDSASGMHPRHSAYYIRRIRISATDALFKMLRDQGIPYQPEVGQHMDSATTYVLEFPVKAPKGAIFKDDITAIEQLEHWKVVKVNFTEHNPSVTISVGDDEWIAVANWVYENWDIVGGLSFLPRSNHVYQLAPYEPIDERRYKELLEGVKDIDFSKIVTYEKADETEVKKELACVSGVCEI